MCPIEWIEQTSSTNSAMSAEAERFGHCSVLAAVSQSAGRGQRGNHWEAEPGRNLTFSMMIRPSAIDARRQFELSMLVSLGICEALAQATGLAFEIKWPNDIYYRDFKICGILIENSLNGRNIARSIAGIGINVNQDRFISDAPNPISMKMLTGIQYDLKALLKSVCRQISLFVNNYEASPDPVALSAKYHSLLWRRRGTHLWTDAATKTVFEASIETVDLDGTLNLKLSDGSVRRFAFKEVSPVMTGCLHGQ